MRFCMITTFYPPYAFGGDGVYVQQLSNKLAKRGHQVEVVHCRDTYNVLARRTSSITDHNHPNVTVHALKSDHKDPTRIELRGVDWTTTRAFVAPSGDCGYVRLNLKGRERDGIVAPGGAEKTIGRSHLVYGLSVIRMVSRLFEVLNEEQVLSAAKNSSIDFPISLFTGANDFLHILRE